MVGYGGLDGSALASSDLRGFVTFMSRAPIAMQDGNAAARPRQRFFVCDSRQVCLGATPPAMHLHSSVFLALA